MTPADSRAQHVEPAEPNPTLARYQKAIPPARDRLQSRLLVWTMAPLLGIAGVLAVSAACFDIPRISNAHLASISVSILFAVLAWRLKAATPLAAACGGVICILLTMSPTSPGQPHRSGLAPLLALFILTHAATRAGRTRKACIGLAENHHGRNVAQVIANLGVASLLAFPFGFIAVEVSWQGGDYYDLSWVVAVLVLSALCEATADTVSSEIGQAFGGWPILITSFRRVEPGTDGAITLRGTLAGIFAAAVVAGAGAWSMHLSLERASIAFAGGISGLLFDSLLGGTLERKGWIGNDLVNFCSTAFPPTMCLITLRLIPDFGPHRFVSY
jgi:uncharacterized protein (TIGR00297 family)